ncbi:MAG: hypothetical protein H7233_09070, partial [Pseudorhodobacter sp.]|nr:hypothetical protein [Frankiaceae bacterium]
MVVGADGSTVRLVEPPGLPPDEIGEVGTSHVEAVAAALADLLTPASGSVVLVAVDRVAQLAGRQIAQTLDHVVVADTLDA